MVVMVVKTVLLDPMEKTFILMFLWEQWLRVQKMKVQFLKLLKKVKKKLFVKEVKEAKETGTLSLQQIKRQDMLSQDFLMTKSK